MAKAGILTGPGGGIAQVMSVWTGRRPLSRLLLSLELIVLMGGALGPLVIASHSYADGGALSVPVPRWIYEMLVLGLLVLFWCGWCEGGYRLGRTTGTFAAVPWQRRLTLELWSGLLISLLISVLASLSPLLPLVGVFLLFGGVESLRLSGAGRSLPASVLGGFRQSARRVSLAPLRLLSLLVVPGLLLYLNSLVLRIFQFQFRHLLLLVSTAGSTSSGHLQAIPALRMVLLGLLCLLMGLVGAWLFLVSRMDLARNYLRVETLDPFPELESLLTPVRRMGRGVVLLGLLGLLLFDLLALISSELFSRNFFYLALEGSVGVVNTFVQNLIDLLAKFSFILVVLTVVIGLFILLISLGSSTGILNRFLSFLTTKTKHLSAFITAQLNVPGQAIQITTLLSAVGLIATQTYSRIVEAQSLRLEQQKQQVELVRRQQQRQQNYAARAEDHIQRFQQSLQSLISMDKGTKGPDWLDLDLRAQVASLTRDLTRQLVDPDGHRDGQRRSRVLKYLYDSRFLTPDASNQDASTSDASKPKCTDDSGHSDALSMVINRVIKDQSKDQRSPRSLARLPQPELDRELTAQLNGPRKCDLARLVPLNMDFSHANLRGAFLNQAALPFINLNHADLQEVQLEGADLRFANLNDANLKGANLRNARLDYALLNNADLRSAKLDNATLNGAIAFYATYDDPGKKDPFQNTITWKSKDEKSASNGPAATRPERTISSDTHVWCPLDLRMDPELKPPPAKPIPQASAKCSNRAYSGYQRRGDRIRNRNWASGDFSGTTIENFRLSKIDFTNADLRGAVFRYVRLEDIDFTGANLDGAKFENCVLNDVNFTGANISNMEFVDSSVGRLRLRGAQYVLPIQLGDYADELLLRNGRNLAPGAGTNQSPPDRLIQRLLLPLLLAPVPLRPHRVVFWLVPYSPELLIASPERQSSP